VQLIIFFVVLKFSSVENFISGTGMLSWEDGHARLKQNKMICGGNQLHNQRTANRCMLFLQLK
jgi:hypothetical protein